MSSGDNLVLYVASYADATTAKDDFETLKANQGDEFKVKGAVVMSRNATGDVDVLEKGDGQYVAGEGKDTAAGAWIGGGIGLVVGLFAPPLLISTGIGAGIGALLGHMTKKHEEKKLGVELDQYFPPNSSAIAVVLDDKYLDRVEASLVKSDKQVSKAISDGDYDALQKALDDSSSRVDDAVES